VAQPIYFYTKLKEEDWKEKALTFLMISSWLLAAAVTLAIFVIQYIPIGSTLVEGITGWKFLIILPVLITLALVFFMITLLILGGAMVIVFGAAFYLLGLALHYVYLLLGAVPAGRQGKGHLNQMLQDSFYSSAVVLAGIFPVLFALLTKAGTLDFSLFRVGYNLVYGLTLLYVYGLWAVAGRKVYGVPKWKAFAGALVPIIFLLIFGFVFDKIALSKLEAWITPLK